MSPSDAFGVRLAPFRRHPQVVYENTHFESRSWHDLRSLLVAHTALDAALGQLLRDSEADSIEALLRQLDGHARRAVKKRDLDEECEQYLPREGCHHSLPPDRVACRLHEALRLSGTCVYDAGPALSD